MTKIIQPEKARQGRRGYQVLVVLVVALMLAAVAWFAAEFYGEAIDDGATASLIAQQTGLA